MENNNKHLDNLANLIKRYAEHFTLIFDDDVSEWDDELEMETYGGGAFLPGPFQSPPDLFLTNDGTMFISYSDEKMPGDMFMDEVSPDALEEAILNDEPLHDPDQTRWNEKHLNNQ